MCNHVYNYVKGCKMSNQSNNLNLQLGDFVEERAQNEAKIAAQRGAPPEAVDVIKASVQNFGDTLKRMANTLYDDLNPEMIRTAFDKGVDASLTGASPAKGRNISVSILDLGKELTHKPGYDEKAKIKAFTAGVDTIVMGGTSTEVSDAVKAALPTPQTQVKSDAGLQPSVFKPGISQ